MPAHPVVPAAESAAIAHTSEQPERNTEMPGDVAVLLGVLGKRLDDPALRELILDLNQGAEPVVRTEGDALIGESRICFLAAAGVILYSSDRSGAGQRIGQVTLVGSVRKVYEQGRERAVAAFRGSLPLSLNWGQTRGEILKRLGQPTLSNEGIGISDRPKTPIRETRDADEYQQGNVIIRLIYADTLEGPGGLEEIDLQHTTGMGR
ncbi:MAG: hypothetical protein HXY20_13745 [Acidobacteria bacterium]|nr:hypothetical protein [Acidobacteriota bacterium]